MRPPFDSVQTWRPTAALALTIVALLGITSAASAEAITGRARIIDGDTIAIDRTQIRLQGIDAPELHQRCSRGGRPYRCGEESKAALRHIIAGAALSCSIRGADRYGRVIATCARVSASSSPQDIGRELVREGWAVAFTRYSKAYVVEEREARELRRGLWAGDFERPEEWRREHRRPHDG
jgi:endonuclease YncB( thermonuclease family)